VIAFLQGGSPFHEKVSNPTLPRIGSRTAPLPLTRNGPPSERDGVSRSQSHYINLFASMLFSSYYASSFNDRNVSPPGYKWGNALWSLRTQYGQRTMDSMMLAVFQTWSPTEDGPVDPTRPDFDGSSPSATLANKLTQLKPRKRPLVHTFPASGTNGIRGRSVRRSSMNWVGEGAKTIIPRARVDDNSLHERKPPAHCANAVEVQIIPAFVWSALCQSNRPSVSISPESAAA
jgi:hypothetical protein